MTSDDISRIELLFREHFARTDKQLSDMKAENAEFHTQMIKEFNTFIEKVDKRITSFEEKMDKRISSFEERVDKRISSFEEKVDAKISAVDSRISVLEEKVDTRFNRLEAKVEVMQNDITGLKHDVSNLYTWNYWTLSIIIALLAMPQIVEGIKSLLGAVTDVISAVARIFRKEDKA